MKYLKEVIILLIQLLMFYLCPLFMGDTDMIGLILLIVIGTFILSIVLGFISRDRFKYIYPLVICILFLPSVFIYYNESALVHALWYLIISLCGMLVGTFCYKLINKR